MPFYDYKCTQCGHEFEEFQHINDEALTECPKCLSTLKRLISETSAQVVKDAKEVGEQLKNEARKDAQDIMNGDMEKAADYLGEKRALDFFRTK